MYRLSFVCASVKKTLGSQTNPGYLHISLFCVIWECSARFLQFQIYDIIPVYPIRNFLSAGER